MELSIKLKELTKKRLGLAHVWIVETLRSDLRTGTTALIADVKGDTKKYE